MQRPRARGMSLFGVSLHTAQHRRSDVSPVQPLALAVLRSGPEASILSRYLRAWRLAIARKALSGGETSVADVVDMVGSFARLFRPSVSAGLRDFAAGRCGIEGQWLRFIVSLGGRLDCSTGSANS